MSRLSNGSAEPIFVRSFAGQPDSRKCPLNLRFAGGAALLILIACTSLQAATLPNGFAETLVAGGISNASAMTLVPDGRIFVCEQEGKLRVIKNGALLSTPFLTVPVSFTGERGLLGVAVDPNFQANQFVYIYYTATTPAIHNRISRFTANGDVAVPGSEVIILELNNLSGATNHNGGAIHFGPDGKLYAGVGENANTANAQTLANLLGKILRINPDGTVPTDNPFYGNASGINRAIWAIGLRNPFTFAFQRGTGRMFVNDVGAGSAEEVNDGLAGANYGWPATEGYTTNPNYRSPNHAYGHGGGNATGCAITGGAFYNPVTVQFPSEYVGDYFFADLCSGWIRKLDPTNNSVVGFATGISAPVDLVVSDDGSLYYLARNTGAVFKVQYTANLAPTISTHPSNKTVSVGQSATFTVSASGASPLSYQWQRNGANISGATTSSYTVASAQPSDNNAKFRAIVSNSYGSATSNEGTLTVTSNGTPTGSITQPAAGALYNAGNTINYAGTGTDPEDGTLPASAFTWQVDFHHDTHTHPFITATSGAKSGSFTIPTTGETSANVWYRIHLSVKDSGGLTHASFIDILPRKSTVTLATNPSGMQIKLDGQPMTAPTSFTGVVGMVRSIEAVSPQTVGGTNYQFNSWSDGGAAAHTIATPASNTTYTATYSIAGSTTGNGLFATYYDNIDFTGAAVTRVDPTVTFYWGDSPISGIGPDTFSVRWTGQVQPQFTQTYTFYTLSDDGVRLWVNNQLIVNNWTDHGPTENSGTISLVANQKYDIRMELFENVGRAVAWLSWSSPSQPKQTIPKSRLYSGTPPPPPPPPSGWSNQDIGSVGSAGSYTNSSGSFTIKGSGYDIWDNADAFHFVYQTLNGNGEILARVSSVQNTDSWAKAGVMIRESLAPGSAHAMMIVSASSGTSFQRRPSTGGNSFHTTLGGVAAPYWVRLVRSGNTFTGYYSSNGSTWQQMGSQTIPMGSSVLVGLAVTSHNSSALNTSTIDNVTIK